jgi:hypothetical protein
MGFKNDWQSDKWQNVLDYYQVIYETFQMNFGLCLLRLKAGLDCSHPLENFYPEDSDLLSTDQKYLEKNIPFNQSSNCKTKGSRFFFHIMIILLRSILTCFIPIIHII